MTIRRKLFLFIPLLVVIANTVAFFVFQSGQVVQRSYDDMLGRIVQIRQTTESAERNLNLLYDYLLDPGDDRSAMASAGLQLAQLGDAIGRQPEPAGSSLGAEGYVNLLASLTEQQQAAVKAAEAKDLQTAFTHYVEAEKTVGFIREEGQGLIDAELSYYRPLVEQIGNENERMNRLGGTLFAMNTLMGVLLAVWVSRSITGPVGRLVGLAKQIATGNLNIGPQPRRNDELGILSNAIQQMSADLGVLIEKDKQSLEMQRLVKELELQALQSQIHPHFLFNTLNVLSRLALLEGAERTSDLIVSMSNMLRYSLQKLDQPVTFKDELEHVKEYAAIQQARFRDRIAFELDFDPSVLKEEIPALTLQPLLENAYLHGVANLEKGAVISLKLWRTDSDIRIEISDNGAGMTDAVRQSLLRLEAGTAGGKSTGLGTRNVFKRLQLFYGKENLVEIRSHPGEGTVITIRIPARNSAEQGGDHRHAQTADRG